MADPGSINSPIAEWFSGRSILVTGGTGFMGKVLIEKLLRSCPDIAAIYMLIRSKRGSDVHTRLEELLNMTIFDKLRKEHSESLKKLVPVNGDVMCPELGISLTDQKTLIDNVSVVFHSAATVKFDEPLKRSVSMNIIGTKYLVQLCQRMMKLEALVHVSTAYCNCNREEINELVYPPPADPEKIIQYVEWMDDDLLNSITPKIIGNHPNTYTFTKALAEHMLVEQSGNLPVAIVRPSIVTAAWKEPIPGWIDNFNGPTGIIAGAGKGILRSILCYRDLVADIIPVDVAINLLISVAWHTATARPNNILVYNCTSGNLNPIKWGDIEDIGHEFILKNPFNDVLWYPGGSFKSNWLLNNICVVAFHVVPAYLMDIVAKLSGKKPIMVRLQKKLHKAISCVEFFTTHQWQFDNYNVTRLVSHLHAQDRKTFNFDILGLEWRPYVEQYVHGTRTFILKEDPSTIPSARIHMRKMYWVHRFSQLVTLMFIWRLILRFRTARRLIFTFLNLLLSIFSKIVKMTHKE